MASGPQFYCPVLGIDRRRGNERLGGGACHGSRYRLRHSISAVGPETPSTEKRPLGLPQEPRAGPTCFLVGAHECVLPPNPHEGSRNPARSRLRAGFSCVGQRFSRLSVRDLFLPKRRPIGSGRYDKPTPVRTTPRPMRHLRNSCGSS